jgi:hypothetical protein
MYANNAICILRKQYVVIVFQRILEPQRILWLLTAARPPRRFLGSIGLPLNLASIFSSLVM